MRCPNCQFESPPGMKFCGQCGGKLGPLCPRCGFENPPGFKFCGECGTSLTTAQEPGLPPAPPEPVRRPAAPVLQSYTPPHLAAQVLRTQAALEGERKQVTVLFCDLVGSTSLADRLGPETMHLLLNRFFELALSEVHRYEGTINQFLGDGFMALFGAPITHEDHPRRAALAALGLQKLLAEHRDELGEPHGVHLEVRMGLNTGWVVVGGIGDQLRKDYTAIGDTTNLAARMQQIATPGTILVSEATARLLQGSMQLEPLPPVQVKGKEEPVLAFKLLSATQAPSAQATMSGRALSPFIGRQREMAILEEVRDQAAAGQGQVVGIAAEAGTGKSRLLYELRRRPGTRSAVWLSGRCLSYGTGTPYLPILFMLRGEWSVGDGDPPGVVTAKVRAGLERLGIEPEAPLPYLLRLLGVEEGTERLAELSPQALQARTFSALRQVVLASGGDGLVVLEIEDLHWADQTSEDFLTFLVEGIPATRTLLLGTYRPGYRPPWIEKSYATQIPLRRLTDMESRTLVEASLHELELPEESMSAILDKAEGNPFFLEELTRSLLERPDVSVPDTVQGVILARIDRLPEEQKRLLQTASVLGREFSQRLLAAVWERPETLVPLLGDLKRWEFLYEEPTAEEPFYFFKHGLTQEAVYQTLLTSRRRALHDAAGEAFETLYADRLEEVYDRLAYHYSKAEAPAPAVRYLTLSAEKAARGYAHSEAARALREALGHAERLPATERDRATLEVALRLAESLLPLARFAETLEVLSLHQDALDRVADAALAGRYHFWLAHTHSYMGNQEEVEVHAGQAIDAARQSGDTRTEGRTWYLLCRDAFWAGRFKEGIEDGRRAVELLEASGDRWWQGQALWVAGFHYYVLGRFDESLAAMDQAHAIWEALQDPRLDPSWSTGFFLSSLGDWERGIELCRGGLERAGDPLNTAAALGFLGYGYLEKGDLPRAMEALEESVRRLRQAGMQQLLGWYSAFLAEACLLAGRPAEARERALEALTVTDGAGFRYGSGFAQRTLGHIAAAEDDPELAEAWLRQALATFQSLDAPFEVARTLLDLGQLAGEQGDLPEAGSRLAEARGLFEELGVSYWEERAEEAAADLGLTAQAEKRAAPFGG